MCPALLWDMEKVKPDTLLGKGYLPDTLSQEGGSSTYIVNSQADRRVSTDLGVPNQENVDPFYCLRILKLIHVRPTACYFTEPKQEQKGSRTDSSF